MKKQKELPATFHDRLDSTYMAIEPVCMELKTTLEHCGFSEDEFKSEILLREAFSNAVLHGNKFDSYKKTNVSRLKLINCNKELLDLFRAVKLDRYFEIHGIRIE